MEKSVMLVTVNELTDVLMSVERGQFCHLVTETVVRMNKTNNPYYGKVTKLSSCNFLTGNDYENRVKSNMEKEGLNPETFVVEKPKGKTHLSTCVLVNDTDPTVKYFQVERFKEVVPTVEYRFNGDPIEKTMFDNFMVKVYESQKQEQDRKVYPLTFTITNIRECTLNGVKYVVIPDVNVVETEKEETVTV